MREKRTRGLACFIPPSPRALLPLPLRTQAEVRQRPLCGAQTRDLPAAGGTRRETMPTFPDDGEWIWRRIHTIYHNLRYWTRASREGSSQRKGQAAAAKGEVRRASGREA